jgi:hypothetical protein
MKISPNGAPILHGEGVAAVRKKIDDAFNDVRSTSAERAERAEIDIEVVDNIELMIADSVQLVEGFEIEEIEVELIELDMEQDPEACIRDADEHASIPQQAQPQHAVGDYHWGAYHISVPFEDSATVIEQALRALGEDAKGETLGKVDDGGVGDL